MPCGRSSGLSSEHGGSSDRRIVGWQTQQHDHPTIRPSDREGQTLAGKSLLVRYANLVRLPHTVFALPFALLGVVAASFRYPVTVRQLVLVVTAFTAARFVAMGFNRIADRELDARNPRTRTRELPAGRLSPAQAWIAVIVA